MKKQLLLIPFLVFGVAISGCRTSRSRHSNDESYNSSYDYEVAGKFYLGVGIQEENIKDYDDWLLEVQNTTLYFYSNGKMEYVTSQGLVHSDNQIYHRGLTVIFSYSREGSSLSYCVTGLKVADFTIDIPDDGEKKTYHGEITNTGLVLEMENDYEQIYHAEFKFGGYFKESHASSSSIPPSPSSEPKWTDTYDNEKINNAFKGIVREYLYFMTDERISLKDVIMVHYSLNKENTFDLSICVTSEESYYVYYYECKEIDYSGYVDFLAFLLEPGRDLFLDGETSLNTFREIDSGLKADKRYIMASNATGSIKYVFGSYFKDDKYYVYEKEAYSDGSESYRYEQEIDIDNLLYGYYRYLYQ